MSQVCLQGPCQGRNPLSGRGKVSRGDTAAGNARTDVVRCACFWCGETRGRGGLRLDFLRSPRHSQTPGSEQQPDDTA